MTGPVVTDNIIVDVIMAVGQLLKQGALHEPLDHGESLWVSGDDVAVQSHVLLVQLADGRRRSHAQLNHGLVNHVDPANTITYSDIS